MPAKLIPIFDSEENFWELNPQFKTALSFKDLYKEDKSKNKKNSSIVMWFIAYTHDMGSLFYNLPEKERFEIIGEDYANDIDYYKNNEKVLIPLVLDYTKLTTTAIDRHLLEWDARLEDRTRFLATTKYDLDNYDKLDKMNANTLGVFKNLEKIKEDIVKDESGTGDTKGGFKESLNDSGQI